MQGIIIEYHLIFIILAVLMFLFTILMLFTGEKTNERVIGAWMVIMVNMNFCGVNVWGFLSINVWGIDSDGLLVNNPIADMYFGWALFFGLFLVNVALLFYIPKVFRELAVKKEREERVRKQSIGGVI